jgi:hypothetical protein
MSNETGRRQRRRHASWCFGASGSLCESVLLPDSAGIFLLNQCIDSGSAFDRKDVEDFTESNDKTDLSSSSSVPLQEL